MEIRKVDVELFALAEQFSKGTAKGLQWVNDLKIDAFTYQLPSWIERLTGYVHGLWAVDVISLEQLDDFDKLKAEAGF